MRGIPFRNAASLHKRYFSVYDSVALQYESRRVRISFSRIVNFDGPGEDGGFSGSHWGRNRGGANVDRGGRGDGARPGRGARSGPNERGFGRGRGQSNKPAEK